MKFSVLTHGVSLSFKLRLSPFGRTAFIHWLHANGILELASTGAFMRAHGASAQRGEEEGASQF